jgi:hypothetical protein
MGNNNSKELKINIAINNNYSKKGINSFQYNNKHETDKLLYNVRNKLLKMTEHKRREILIQKLSKVF